MKKKQKKKKKQRTSLQVEQCRHQLASATAHLLVSVAAVTVAIVVDHHRMTEMVVQTLLD